MIDSLFSSHWYRVAELKPRLRDHVRLHRHVYRDHVWYILENRAGERKHRFSPKIYQIVGLMDGQKTIDAIWGYLNEKLGDSAPTQDQVIQLLGQLHGADALQCDIPPDSVEIFQRYRRHRDKQWKRMAVGAAGMLIELFLATVALAVWLNAEPGLVRDIAFNVMLIGGVSTLFFNGNPLLRFDGYYILADAIEIPNLSARSSKYYGYLIQRYLFGVRDMQSPVTASGEGGWFLIYGLGAFIYRVLVAIAIILFVAGKYFSIGIILATWATFSMLIMPTIRAFRSVLANPRIQRQRSRALACVAALAGATVALIFFAPMPQTTISEGVIWLPEDSIVRAGSDGFIKNITAKPNSRVEQGALLITSEDPLLPLQTKLLALQKEELEARHASEKISNRVKADLTQEEIATVQAELKRALEREEVLVIHSSADGVFVVPNFQDLPGRFVRQGEILAYVLDHSSMTARVVVPQSRADLVRQRTEKVTVRLANHLGQTMPATIKRKVPAATNRLPSKALGTSGGGSIDLDPTDAEGITTRNKIFQFDLALPANGPPVYSGGRVYARFDHGPETLAKQAYRAVRQVFLRRFKY